MRRPGTRRRHATPTPSTRMTNRPTPLRAVTQAPPGPAGSGISTTAACAASRSMMSRLVGLPTSSSGVSSSTIGRGVFICWRRIERTAWNARKLPAFMS